jgi:PAS domain S-box-containing protein
VRHAATGALAGGGVRAAARLRRLNATLEERVASRTAQLERAVHELRASEARYAAMFEHTSAGIILVSVEPDGSFRYEAANPMQLQQTGFTPERWIGSKPHEIFPPALADRIVDRYRRCVATGESISYEDRLVFPIGERTEQITLAPVRGADGRIGKLLLSIQDVTEQRRVEEQLRRSQRMEAVGKLTGGVAHDFNNLLTIIIGNLELLADERDPRRQRLVQSALRAAGRGARLTAQLLAFARLQRLHPETIRAEALLAESRDLLRRAAGETIRLEIDVAADPWPCRIDAAQFESSILNAVLNARDAMPPSGGTIRITTRNVAIGPQDGAALELTPGDYVAVAVADDGGGMPPEVTERAFEPFFTTKEVGQGSGLGLSQLYGFARQSGGTATLDSAVGRGTVVMIYLPRAADEPVAEAAGSRKLVRAVPGRTVLAVEDHPEVLEYVTNTLEELGYRVLTAADGVAALAILHSDAPIDLLFSDIVMPNGLSGIDLAREARRLRRDLRILLTTGYAGNTVSDAGDDWEILAKPYRPADLAAKLAEVLPSAAGAR